MASNKAGRRNKPKPLKYELYLYIAGTTEKSLNAIANLERICAEHLEGQYRIRVINLIDNPKLARDDQILAIPTLVRRLPQPRRKIVGDLSHTERVLVGLDVRPRTRALSIPSTQGFHP